MLFGVMLLCLFFAGTASAAQPVSPDVHLDLGYGQGSFRAAISGSLAYAVGSKFQVYDLSDPLAPARLYSASNWVGSGYDVVAFGRYALTISIDKLNIIDVADPYAPMVVGTVSGINSGNTSRMAISSHYVFITTGGSDIYGNPIEHSLKVVDISVPTTPVVVGSLALAGNNRARGIAISGRYAFLAIDSGMAVVDILNPAAPVLVTNVPLASTTDPNTTTATYGVAVQGNYAYLTSHGVWSDPYEGAFDTSGYLHVIDIATPPCPAVLSEMATPRAAEDITVSGSFAYIIEKSIDYYPGRYQFLEVNIVNPSAPLAERYFLSNFLNSAAQGAAVIGDYVFQPITTGALVFARQPEPFSTCTP